MGSNRSHVSPLRYPGGKSRTSTFIEDIILLNNLEGCTFYELYAGGAGASLNLLFSGVVKKIVLNDLDFHIHAFWQSIMHHTDEFLRLVHDAPVDIENWKTQSHIYGHFKEFDTVSVGFSAFFLNRTNRSGILYNAGPIGGFDQSGNYKIDVRFNKLDLIGRVERIADLRDKISLYNRESIELLQKIFSSVGESRFIFLDPPYYVQGERLYLDFYQDDNHVNLRDILIKNREGSWFLTYDNCSRINELYSGIRRSHLSMSYTLQDKKQAKEVMMFSDDLYLPRMLRIGSKSTGLELIG